MQLNLYKFVEYPGVMETLKKSPLIFINLDNQIRCYDYYLTYDLIFKSWKPYSHKCINSVLSRCSCNFNKATKLF